MVFPSFSSNISHISQPRWLNPGKCSTHPPSWSRPTTVTAAIKSNWVLLFLQGWATAQCRPHCVVLEGCGMAVLYGGLYLPYFILGPILCVLCWGYETVFIIVYCICIGCIGHRDHTSCELPPLLCLILGIRNNNLCLSLHLWRDFSTLG